MHTKNTANTVGDVHQYERREFRDPVTGRGMIQLTSGEEYCYPLYFFGPTVSADGGTIIFHRYRDDEVQNWKLDVASGQATCLTAARTPNCLRRFWQEARVASGVRELMSAFSPSTDEMVYFDSNTFRLVNVRTLADRVAYELPADRVPCTIPGTSPDGTKLVFAHVDRKWWEESTDPSKAGGMGANWLVRHEAKRVRLDVLELATGQVRTLINMNSMLTHANFYDNERVIFCHHPTESAVLMTDLRGGWYTHLRTQSDQGLTTKHYLATKRGIAYETNSPLPLGVMGLCDPETYASRDYRVQFPVSHTGYDPAARLWFAECYRPDPPHDRFLAWLPRLQADRVNEFVPLTRGANPYDNNRLQRSHMHPVLMPDRRQILFIWPDDRSKTNHLHLLDIADLADVDTEMD